MKKNWKLKKFADGNAISGSNNFDEFVKEIRSVKTKVQLPDIILKLLFLRNIKTYHEIIKFFKPTIEKLYDPFLLKDCDIASDRIIQAIKEKEKIMIVGDYDVDGTCGASMLYLFLKSFDIEPVVYIPNRIEEGYGISDLSIETAAEDGIQLVISVDCGITANEQVAIANQKNIPVIICDHHQPPEEIPDAFAVLDPLRKDCIYPFKYLCGTGVAFKLIQAVCIKMNNKEFYKTFLDFVAIATASDIVPITDENRILVSEGLKTLNEKPRESFRVLLENIGLKKGDLNTTNIVYLIAPRINAVGRLGDAFRAVELLTSNNPEKLSELADILNTENSKRREFDKNITEEAYKLFEEAIEPDLKHSIILHNDDWHSGVIGIVAARLVEKYNLPSIVLTTVKGVAKGSARSINGFNIYEALKKCGDLLLKFGGHYHAAGLELELDKLEEFKKVFNQIACEEIMKHNLNPEIEIDAVLTFDDITPKFKKILSFFEPFGPGNTHPVFMTKNLRIIGEQRFKNKTHLFRLRDDSNMKFFDAVFFSSEEFYGKIFRDVICDVCYTIEKSVWNNTERYKLRIIDIIIQN